jgi:hypothetical protein
MNLLGSTRSRKCQDHVLLAREIFVRSTFAGMGEDGNRRPHLSHRI